MLKVAYAKNPMYTNADGTCIHLIVKFEGVGDEVPFAAMKNDGEAHGKALYENAKSGLYGTVAAFVPPDAAEPALNQE